MTSVDDQFNQVFSSIIHSSREMEFVSYEGETFSLGTGPLRRSPKTGEIIVILDEFENILGRGHPLIIKNLLLSSLDGLQIATEKEIGLLNNELETFLSSFAPGIKCALGIALGKKAYELGRSVNFFEEGFIQSLNSFGPQYTTNLFPVPLTLYTKDTAKTETEVFISKSDLRLVRSQLRLFELGNIFGAGGAIEKKQELLIGFFKEIDKLAEVNGLIVKTKMNLSEKGIRVSSTGNLLFPLLFDELSLKTIGDTIGK